MNVYILFSDNKVIGVANSQKEAENMLTEYEFSLGSEDCGDLSFQICEVGEFCD
jgi:hypothetical protein